jgi:hypothetical protein
VSIVLDAAQLLAKSPSNRAELRRLAQQHREATVVANNALAGLPDAIATLQNFEVYLQGQRARHIEEADAIERALREVAS